MHDNIGSLAGEVCLWDIRLTEPVRTMKAHQGGMVQLAVHEHAPIFATYVLRRVYCMAPTLTRLWSEQWICFQRDQGLEYGRGRASVKV